MNLMLNILVIEGESDHNHRVRSDYQCLRVLASQQHGSPAPSSGEQQACSQLHGQGRGRRLQLLVQQAEQHGAPVALRGLTQ